MTHVVNQAAAAQQSEWNEEVELSAECQAASPAASIDPKTLSGSSDTVSEQPRLSSLAEGQRGSSDDSCKDVSFDEQSYFPVSFHVLAALSSVSYDIKVVSVDAEGCENISVAASILHCPSDAVNKSREAWIRRDEDGANVNVYLIGITDSHAVKHIQSNLDTSSRYSGYYNPRMKYLHSDELCEYLSNSGLSKYELCSIPLASIPEQSCSVRTIVGASYPHVEIICEEVEQIKLNLERELNIVKRDAINLPVVARVGIYCIAEIDGYPKRGVVVAMDMEQQTATVFLIDAGRFELEVPFLKLNALTGPLLDIPVIALRSANVEYDENAAEGIKVKEVTFITRYAPYVLAGPSFMIKQHPLSEEADGMMQGLIWPGNEVYAFNKPQVDRAFVIRPTTAERICYDPFLEEETSVMPPVPPRFVLVQYNGHWFRAERSGGNSGDHYDLIDDGFFGLNSGHFSKVLPLPERYMKYPKLTQIVSLADDFELETRVKGVRFIVEIENFDPWVVRLHRIHDEPSPVIQGVDPSGHFVLDTPYFSLTKQLLGLQPVDFHPPLTPGEAEMANSVFKGCKYDDLSLLCDALSFVRKYAKASCNAAQSVLKPDSNMEAVLSNSRSELLADMRQLVKNHVSSDRYSGECEGKVFAIDGRRCESVNEPDLVWDIDECELVEAKGPKGLPLVIQKLPPVGVLLARAEAGEGLTCEEPPHDDVVSGQGSDPTASNGDFLREAVSGLADRIAALLGDVNPANSSVSDATNQSLTSVSDTSALFTSAHDHLFDTTLPDSNLADMSQSTKQIDGETTPDVEPQVPEHCCDNSSALNDSTANEPLERTDTTENTGFEHCSERDAAYSD